MSGTTSQPNLNSIRGGSGAHGARYGIEFRSVEPLLGLLGGGAHHYTPFDNAPKSGTADVYIHEMPGGQYTNLKEQAEAMGLGNRWPEIARMYADVNKALGDIIKVTPSSKAVGDLALYLISRDMSVKDLENLPPDHQHTFPNSVVDMFMGSLGQPEGGWPPKLQQIILRGRSRKGRPGERLKPMDLEQEAARMAEKPGVRVVPTS